MERFIVIMAGGIGSRLWPISTSKKPKQFMQMPGGKSIITATVERIADIVPPGNCYIITNINQKSLMEKEMNALLPYSNILYEPCGKNTAACMA